MGSKRPKMRKIAFYTRISTDEDHQKYSLAAQKERLEAFCQSQYGDDWQLISLYRDTESATHLNRPGLQQLLSDAQARAFDTVLVFRVDRLSRNVKELSQLIDELTNNNIALKSITEPFDTTNAAGKMMLQMLGVFAEFEHKTIIERTKAGMEKKAKGGTFVGGVVPYGYRLDPDQGLLPADDEASLVEQMFRMYAVEKMGAQSISVKLNHAGERKRSGKPWDKRVILHILQSPIYIGKLVWRGITYDAAHEAIISQQLFDRVQRTLRGRREDLKGRQWHNQDERLLTGRIKCRSCRSHMFGGGARKNGRYIPYYVCSERASTHSCDQDYVRADRIEAAIIEDIKTIFRDREFLDRVRKKVNQKLRSKLPDVDKDISRLDRQEKNVKARLDRYFEAFENGTMKPELCGRKVEELTTRLDQLREQKRSLEQRRDQLRFPAVDHAAIATLIDNLEDVMAVGTNAQKKHLVGLLVKKVLVHHRDKIEVWYQVPNAQRFQGFEHWNNWLPG
jgi:site-specific DNA recombinase